MYRILNWHKQFNLNSKQRINSKGVLYMCMDAYMFIFIEYNNLCSMDTDDLAAFWLFTVQVEQRIK